MGDPTGIGPWLASQAVLMNLWRGYQPLVIGDAWVLQCLAGLPARIHPVAGPEEIISSPRVINVLHVPHPGIRQLVKGKPSALSGEAAALSLRAAAALCLQGRVRGIFTGPVSKESFFKAGLNFNGQTEFLAHLTGARDPEMLMMGGKLKVVLVTRHLPLSKVSGQLNRQRIVACVRSASEALQRHFGIRSPRIGVCGLNPHAGDGQVLGHEEKTMIQPAVRLLSKQLKIEGPFAADSLLSRAAQGAYDLVVAMYHDQAMIALKVHAPREVVNVTVGLPFPRVSPGHGTAFNLARTPKKIDLGPTRAAVERLLSLV